MRQVDAIGGPLLACGQKYGSCQILQGTLHPRCDRASTHADGSDMLAAVLLLVLVGRVVLVLLLLPHVGALHFGEVECAYTDGGHDAAP